MDRLKQLAQVLRMTANSLQGGFGRKIFFLHIPKCGGMSVHDAIVGCYGIGEKFRGHRRFDHPATYVAALRASGIAFAQRM